MAPRRITLGLLVAALGGPALAQDPPPVAPPAEVQGPRLPVLQRAAPAAWPRGTTGAGARVVVRVGVAADGAISGVALDEGAGEPFDAAALQAAWNLVFSPALDERGDPAPAAISYAFTFSALAPVPPVLTGRITVAGSGEPLTGVALLLSAEGQAPWQAITGEDGTFSLAGPEPGRYALTATKVGWETLTASVEIQADNALDLDLSMGVALSGDKGGSETVIVEDRRGSPQVTERVVPIEQLKLLPGSGGDAIKAVQNMPGVARAPFGLGQLVIRGTGPEDSAYYLDGARIPLVFHFGGLSTVLNSDILEEVAYLPGGYGARYGRTLGGVIDLRTNPRLPAESSGYASVDLYQSTLFVQQRLGENTALSISGRRSYIDYILDPVLDKLGAGAVRAPRYWDAQGRLLHRLPGGRLEALALASDDRFVITGDDEDVDAVALGLYIRFQKAMLRWDQDWGPRWHTETTFLTGPELTKVAVLGGEARQSPLHFVLREEATRTPAEGGHAVLRLGADVTAVRDRYLYDLSDFGLEVDETAWSISPSPYAELGLQFGPLALTPGLRVDPWFIDTGYSALSVDPRFSARWSLGQTTAIKGSLGRYSQFPQVDDVLEALGGDPGLGPEHAIQSTLGAEQSLSPKLSLDGTAFWYELSDLIVRSDDTSILEDRPHVNAGVGRVTGLEGLLRLNTDKGFGWIAATWSRSLRASAAGEDLVPFDYDQPVVLTALASYELPRRWRLGARLRLGSGDPYTPVVGRTLDLDQGDYDAIRGERNSDRLPTYWTLDVRADKEWVFRRWKLDTYLDLQNATNHRNVEVMSWSWDYTEEQPITGLPILPVFGVQGSW